MSMLLRPSTRRLACVAGVSVRISLRPATRLFGDAAGGSAAGPTVFSQTRFASKSPKTPDHKEGPYQDSNKETDRPGNELRPGYVRYSEEQVQDAGATLAVCIVKQASVNLTMVYLRRHGGPPELLELSKKWKAREVGLFDLLDCVRMSWKLSGEVGKMVVDDMQKRGLSPFDGLRPFAPNTPDQQAKKNQERKDDEPNVFKDAEEQKKATEQKDAKEQKPGKQETSQSQQDHQPGSGHQGKQFHGPNKGSQKRRSKDDGPKGPFDRNEVITTAVSTAAAYAIYKIIFPGESSREITWQELRKNFLDKGLVEKLVISGHTVRVQLNREAVQQIYPDSVAASAWFSYYFSIGSVDAFEKRLESAQDELGIPAYERIAVTYQSEGMLANAFFAFGPTIVFVALLAWASRRNGGGGSSGIFGFAKSRAKMFNHESAVRVKFADVAGMDEAKIEIMEFVSFLKTPEKFEKLGAKIPRGAILSGPPGTGKTLLAKATAGESGVPFFSVSGSEFVEMFVGVGASRVRDLFTNARKNAPCIVFIDEIDAIGKARQSSARFGGNDEREATLNQILTEMDGFNTSEQVVVLAGTNRPDTLDKALMRPGRFDRHIHIDRPTATGRAQIFKVHLAKIMTKEDVDYLVGRLAALTPGFAGADIANVVNEAALIAARANAESVQMVHFEQAIERVIGGLERKSLVLSPDEKKTVAYHEAGHAICGWYMQWADPLLKVSIIPRGQGALGYAQYLAADAYLMSTRQLMDRMAMTLGGRVSEELHFPTVTTGASDDFKKVTQMATAMVTQWGMSEKLGPLSFQNDPQSQVQKPFAESTAQTIDTEVRRIVDEAYKQCRDLLAAKKKEIGLVAEELLRKEMLDRDDMIRLLGKRPFEDREEFSKFFDGTRGQKSAPGSEEGPIGGGGEAAPVLLEGRRDWR